jgi:hypothetical protein
MSVSREDLDYDAIARRGGGAAMRQLGRFFMGDDEVHITLRKIAKRLDDLQIPYAVAGAMALNAHGFRRATLDVDMLVTPAGLKRIHEELEGRGYVAPFVGSKNLKDTETTVRIEFLVAGQFPGDGKPKPIPFPEPQTVAVEVDGVKYLGLPTLVELKLASGMTNPMRLKDLADVIELIRLLKLPHEFGSKLNDYVRPKFDELWTTVATYDTPDAEQY